MRLSLHTILFFLSTNVGNVVAMCGRGPAITTTNRTSSSGGDTSSGLRGALASIAFLDGSDETEYIDKHDVHSRDLVALDHYTATGCIETKDGLTTDGNSFVIGDDCDNNDTGEERGVDMVYLFQDGTGDDIGLLRLRADPTKCMQATHAGVLHHGAWMRVYPCDCTNPLQRFYFHTLRLQDTNWCVAHLGVVVDHYDDHLMLKDCSRLPYGWSED